MSSSGVLNHMRLSALLFIGVLLTSPAWAQPAATSAGERPRGEPSTSADPKSPAEDAGQGPATRRDQALTTTDQRRDLPVSLDKIKAALEEPRPALSLKSVDERPTFRVQIVERQKIEELLATLNFKSSSPAPGGGLYGYEMQRQMFPAVDNPMRQPYAAFNQAELLTILIENLAGKYLGGRALNAVSKAEREHAEAAARDE